MPGHIEKLKNTKNRWKIIVEAGKDPATGNRRRIVRYHTGRKSEAENIMAMIIAELEQGTLVEATKVTVSDWMDTWLQEYKKPVVRPKTYDLYTWATDAFIKPSIGSLPLQKLRPEHLQSLYNSIREKGKSTRLVHLVHQLLYGALKQAIKNRLVTNNVAEATTRPPLQGREVRAMTTDEQDKFLQALATHPLGAAFTTKLGTGLRRGELLGLHWDDVDLENRVLHVQRGIVYVRGEGIREVPPKTKKGRRSVPIPKIVLEFLIRHQDELKKKGLYKPDGPVFPSKTGTYIWPDNFNRSFEKLREELKLNDVNLHALRHTFATRLLELGEDMKVIQELLGHAKEGTTANIYVHVSEKLKRRAVDKLDSVLMPGTTPNSDSGTNRAPKNPPGT